MKLKSKKALVVAAILATLINNGCTPNYVAPRLPLPPRPIMPEIRDSDLDCVSDDTYERIVGRDSDHVNYEQRLEAVIKSTWDGE